MTDNKFLEADRFIEARLKEIKGQGKGEIYEDIKGEEKEEMDDGIMEGMLKFNVQPLAILERAKKAGTYTSEITDSKTGVKINRLYTVGSDATELNKIINEAKDDIICWKALKRIFRDLNELQRPVPEKLKEFILELFEKGKGKGKNKPKTPQIWTNLTRDFVIKIIASETKKKFPDVPMTTSENRQDLCICGLIGKHFDMMPETVKQVVRAKKKLRKST